MNLRYPFWHVTVHNSLVKGEYLGWYSENLTDEIGRVIVEKEFCAPDKTEIKINSPAAF